MRKMFAALIAILVFSACTSTGSLNTHVLKPVKEKPRDREIVGYWKTDFTSKSDIKEVFQKDSLDTRIWFHNDGTFEGIDFPDLSTLTKNDKSGEVTGTWEIKAMDEKWELFMHFNKGEVITQDLATYFTMGQNKKDLVLVESLGDPVSGKRLLFEKVRLAGR